MKGIIKQVLLATCVIGAPTCVFAYPFNPDPQSFQKYMNAVKWNDGSKVFFQNINRCSSLSYGNNDKGWYYCTGGYATITNPMGTKICDLKDASYLVATNSIAYTPNQCRYK